MQPKTADPYRTAVFTGTFDPITLGHLDVIRRGRLLFDHLVVGIGVNPNKLSLFNVEERVEMARLRDGPFANVSVQSFEGLTVQYRPPDRGAGDPPRAAHPLRHGVRVRHDPDQSPARSRRSTRCSSWPMPSIRTSPAR